MVGTAMEKACFRGPTRWQNFWEGIWICLGKANMDKKKVTRPVRHAEIRYLAWIQVVLVLRLGLFEVTIALKNRRQLVLPFRLVAASTQSHD